LEKLAKLDTVAFDKTGTITEGVFQPSQLVLNSTKFSEKKIIEIIAHIEASSTHPIGKSIVDYYGKKVDITKVSDIKPINGMGIMATYENNKIILGNENLMKDNNIDIDTCNCPLTHVYIAINNEFIGFIGLGDKIKAGSKKLITELKKLKVHNIVMLTGNISNSATQVSSELNIDQYFSDLLPDQKLKKIDEYIKGCPKNKYVCFIGDGINDAPSLAKADVGIAMGEIGSQIAIETSDVVITDDKIDSVSLAIRIAKKVNIASKINVWVSLLIKIIVFIVTILVNIFAISYLIDYSL
jgi:Cd2+/Zn2+-exporting ATPase